MEFTCRKCGSTIGYASDLCQRCVNAAARRSLGRELKARHPEPSPFVTDDERQIPLWPIPDGPAYPGGPHVPLWEDANGNRYAERDDRRLDSAGPRQSLSTPQERRLDRRALDIQAAILAGATWATVAKTFGVSAPTIQRALGRAEKLSARGED